MGYRGIEKGIVTRKALATVVSLQPKEAHFYVLPLFPHAIPVIQHISTESNSLPQKIQRQYPMMFERVTPGGFWVTMQCQRLNQGQLVARQAP